MNIRNTVFQKVRIFILSWSKLQFNIFHLLHLFLVFWWSKWENNKDSNSKDSSPYLSVVNSALVHASLDVVLPSVPFMSKDSWNGYLQDDFHKAWWTRSKAMLSHEVQ